jgi:hypothetical protein
MAYPAHDIATMLAGSIALPSPPGGGPIVLTYGANGNLTIGPKRPLGEGVTPQFAVSVLQSGGNQPEPYLGDSGESWHVTRVQVTVRSNLAAFSEGEALARALHRKAHLAVIAGLTYVHAGESDPSYLGSDDEGAHAWVFNLEVGHRR